MATETQKFNLRGRPRAGETAAEAVARRIKEQKAVARKAARGK